MEGESCGCSGEFTKSLHRLFSFLGETGREDDISNAKTFLPFPLLRVTESRLFCLKSDDLSHVSDKCLEPGIGDITFLSQEGINASQPYNPLEWGLGYTAAKSGEALGFV